MNAQVSVNLPGNVDFGVVQNGTQGTPQGGNQGVQQVLLKLLGEIEQMLQQSMGGSSSPGGNAPTNFGGSSSPGGNAPTNFNGGTNGANGANGVNGTNGTNGADAATQAFGSSAQMSPQFKSAFNQWAAKDPGAAQQFASAVQAGNAGSDEMKNVEGFLETGVKNGEISGPQAEALASGGPAASWGHNTLGRDVASNVATGTTGAYGNTMQSVFGAQASGLMDHAK
ncbi:hypothetical protein BWP39_23055 [Paraburkholderia acidicola]|uniref:Uncharacterized protein n=1 Tax=Paraburkholderia acidicola TaxID=1912599 RepID=A0A2A4EN37_9BURK|nr:hypothetical protein [Paraburkholderia acidicola]PCE22561.1 hypothetical protein BWP39_23055 [Paraburkholderia acidicola]